MGGQTAVVVHGDDGGVTVRGGVEGLALEVHGDDGYSALELAA